MVFNFVFLSNNQKIGATLETEKYVCRGRGHRSSFSLKKKQIKDTQNIRV